MNAYQKSITASVLLGLAFLQLLAIAVGRGWIGGAGRQTRRNAVIWHRVEGYIAFAIVLTIAYYCLKLVPGSVKTARVSVHALLGATVLGLLISKVAIMRFFRRYSGRMPTLGAVLLVAIIAIWISSAGWYFVTQSGGY